MTLEDSKDNASKQHSPVSSLKDTVMEGKEDCSLQSILADFADFTEGEPQEDRLNSTLEDQDQDQAVAQPGTLHDTVERASTVTKSPVNSSEEGEDGVSSMTSPSTPRSTADGSAGKRTPLSNNGSSSQQDSTGSQEETIVTGEDIVTSQEGPAATQDTASPEDTAKIDLDCLMTDDESKAERELEAKNAAQNFCSEAGIRIHLRGQLPLDIDADVLVASDMLMLMIEGEEGRREERAAKRQRIEGLEAERRDIGNTLVTLAPITILHDKMSNQESRTGMHLPSPPPPSWRNNLGLKGRTDGGEENSDTDLDLRRQTLDRNHHISLTETPEPTPAPTPTPAPEHRAEPRAFDREGTADTVDDAADDPENNHYHYWPSPPPLPVRVVRNDSTSNSHATTNNNNGSNPRSVKRRAPKAAQGAKAPKAPRVQKKAAAKLKSGSGRDQQPR
ncbi:hypothetical protein BKA61DRAFT_732047 [Leptodontidium sp. MPI-SDFR-AT-0119]|nr:hypothetical protein BKA61DRAFT_732047 [Leptodontidium sp. MPI-SDFR-AT-0119]